MRKIDTFIVHCSATPAGRDIGYKEIRRVHVLEDEWSDIGYHYVIRRSGVIERGRSEAAVGAHAKGHNAHTLGVCLVGAALGVADFTEAQYVALESLLRDWNVRYPGCRIVGHRDVAATDCPGFDVPEWARERGLA